MVFLKRISKNTRVSVRPTRTELDDEGIESFGLSAKKIKFRIFQAKKIAKLGARK